MANEKQRDAKEYHATVVRNAFPDEKQRDVLLALQGDPDDEEYDLVVRMPGGIVAALVTLLLKATIELDKSADSNSAEERRAPRPAEAQRDGVVLVRDTSKCTTPPERNMIARRRCLLAPGPQIPSKNLFLLRPYGTKFKAAAYRSVPFLPTFGTAL
jgi:hypothetical protein